MRAVQRTMLEAVGWNCEIKTLFRDENLGCARAVSGAIDWFLSNEQAGIILEDDCVPNPSFFGYCRQLLDRYRDDPRVMHIGGSALATTTEHESSYFMSLYGHVWGWATWRESWSAFSFDDNRLEENLRRLLTRFPTEEERRYWRPILTKTFAGEIDSWAYRWAYAVWKSGGVFVYPTSNMVKNVGFGSGATHTRLWTDYRGILDRSTNEVDRIEHPISTEVRPDRDIDIFRQAYRKPWLPVRAFKGVVRMCSLRLSRTAERDEAQSASRTNDQAPGQERRVSPGNKLMRIVDRAPAPIARLFRADSWLAGLVRPLLNYLVPEEVTVVTVRSGVGRGLRLPIRPRSEKFYWTGTHEEHVQEALDRLLEPGDTYWDVGSHIGFLATIAARRVGPDGSVVAFEPMPETVPRLRRSIALNQFDNVSILEYAISDSNGEQILRPPREKPAMDGDDPRGPSLMWTLADGKEGEDGVSVSCCRLDDLVEEAGTPDLVKIDAEGAELECLKGAAGLLESGRTSFIIEVSDEPTLVKARELAAGHRFELLGANHWLVVPAAD